MSPTNHRATPGISPNSGLLSCLVLSPLGDRPDVQELHWTYTRDVQLLPSDPRLTDRPHDASVMLERAYDTGHSLAHGLLLFVERGMTRAVESH